MKVTVGLLILVLFAALYHASPLAKHDETWKVNQKVEDSRGQTLMDRSEAIDLLRRITREAVRENSGNRRSGAGGGCKYRKGQWSACDPQTKERIRTYTLKKGDATACEQTKTLRKQCKVKKGKQRNGNQKNRNAKVPSPEQTLRSS